MAGSCLAAHQLPNAACSALGPVGPSHVLRSPTIWQETSRVTSVLCKLLQEATPKREGGLRFGGWNALIIPHLFLPLDLFLVWIRECRRLLVVGKEGDKKITAFLKTVEILRERSGT